MKKEISRAYIALAIVSFFWGTTYIASRIGAQHMPGLFMAGIRQFSSGIILVGFFLAKGYSLPNKEIMRKISIQGIFLLCFANGLLTWSLEYISSGLAAIIAGTGSTVCYSFFNMAFTLYKNFKTDDPWDDHWPRRCCHYILRLPWANTQQVVCFWSCACTPFDTELVVWHGVLFKAKLSIDILFGVGLQMLFAGIVILVVCGLTGKYVNLADTGHASWFALLYLIFFGSLLAYSAYAFAISKLPACAGFHLRLYQPDRCCRVGLALATGKDECKYVIGNSDHIGWSVVGQP
jgi:hypothetical protein